MSFLTPHQLAFMDVFGYLVFPGLLNDRIERIIAEFEAVFARHGGGHYRRGARRHAPARASCRSLTRSEYLAALLDDPRVNGLFTDLLGANYQLPGQRRQLLRRRHQLALRHRLGGRHRAASRRALFYKLALYLDPVDAAHAARCASSPAATATATATPKTCRPCWSRAAETLRRCAGDQVPAIALDQPARRCGDLQPSAPSTARGAAASGGACSPSTAPRHYTDAELPLLRNEVGAFARFWPETRCTGRPCWPPPRPRAGCTWSRASHNPTTWRRRWPRPKPRCKSPPAADAQTRSGASHHF